MTDDDARSGLGAVAPRAAVVIAVLNEAPNVAKVCTEMLEAMAAVDAFEIVFVDDGSTDETPAILADIAARDPRVRLIRHDRRCGKSQAVRTGVLAARAPWIATADGDGQNEPADLPLLLEAAWRAEVEAKAGASAGGAPPRPPLVAGIRVRRNDPLSRLIATRIANGFRAAVLGDRCPDTGCGVKVFPREAFLLLPCFEGMHRFLPALFQRYGHPLINHPVRHHARFAGTSKYTNFGRAVVGLFDMAGVIWLTRRTRAPGAVTEVAPEGRR